MRRRVFVVRAALGSERKRFNGRGWILYERGNPDVVSYHQRKKDAVDAGRFICRRLGEKAQLVVKNRNGRIAYETTYINDPRRSIG